MHCMDCVRHLHVNAKNSKQGLTFTISLRIHSERVAHACPLLQTGLSIPEGEVLPVVALVKPKLASGTVADKPEHT